MSNRLHAYLVTSMHGPTPAGLAAAGLTLATAAAAQLGAPDVVWIVCGSLAIILFILAGVLALADRRSDTPSGAASLPSQSASADHGALAAGRDITVTYASPASPTGKNSISGEVRARAVRDEMRHIQRRFRQLHDNAKEWGSIWPIKEAPYDPLPSEKWNAHNPYIELPDDRHDVIQEAYEGANDFNHVMQRGPRHFGDEEPDLEALEGKFESAYEALVKPDRLSHSSRQALAAAESELRDIRDRLEAAKPVGVYRSAASADCQRCRKASETLAVNGSTTEGRVIDQARRDLANLSEVLNSRSWSGGPIPEQISPAIEAGEVDSAVASIDKAVDVLVEAQG